MIDAYILRDSIVVSLFKMEIVCQKNYKKIPLFSLQKGISSTTPYPSEGSPGWCIIYNIAITRIKSTLTDHCGRIKWQIYKIWKQHQCINDPSSSLIFKGRFIQSAANFWMAHPSIFSSLSYIQLNPNPNQMAMVFCKGDNYTKLWLFLFFSFFLLFNWKGGGITALHMVIINSGAC